MLSGMNEGDPEEKRLETTEVSQTAKSISSSVEFYISVYKSMKRTQNIQDITVWLLVNELIVIYHI